MLPKSFLNLIFFAMAIFLTSVSNADAKIDLVALRDRVSVQTTIYNEADLTLVRDHRVLNLVKGMNRLQFSWANTKIDPTSLSLEIKDKTDQITVIEITYPSGTRDTGIWQIKAEQACRVPFEITYFTSGISWESYYIAQLSKDQKTCELKGYVKVINTSGEDYQNAQTRLIVGKVNILDQIAALAGRSFPYGTPPKQLPDRSELNALYNTGKKQITYAQPMAAMASEDREIRAKEIVKQSLSEYFLYTIEGKETIPHGWAKRLLSFEAHDIKVENIYKYEFNRFGDRVVRFLTFKNEKENNLGKTPLPGGYVNVFRSIGEKGELEFIGSDHTKYIPLSKKVELNLGSTLNVKITPIVMSYEKNHIIFDNNGNTSGFDEVKTVEVQLSNFTDTSSTLEYTKNFDSTHFKISQMTHPDSFKKTDQDTITFTLALDPHSSKKIRYTVTTLIGERRWQQ